MDSMESKGFFRLIFTFIAGVSIYILWQLLTYSQQGIDFTDEGFYLVWMSNPFLYDWSLTQFGFIYHPLFVLFNGDVAVLRQANILITFSLSWILVDSVIKRTFPQDSLSALERIIVSGSLATGSLAFFSTGLVTPNYNSLTLQALIITAIGISTAEAVPSRSSILGWIMIGVGGWLTFMAKPSSALALTICVGICLLLTKRLNVRLISVAAFTALFLLILSALLIDGSVSGFLNRLKTGMTFASYLGGGHTFLQLLRLDDFRLKDHEKLVFFVITGGSFLLALFAYAKRSWVRTVAIALSAAFLAWILFATIQAPQPRIKLGTYKGLLILCIPISAIFFAFVLRLRDSFTTLSMHQKAWAAILLILPFLYILFRNGSSSQALTSPEIIFIAAAWLVALVSVASISNRYWVLAFFFLVLPYVFAFGTATNYWRTGSGAGFFWIIAALILIAPIAKDSSVMRAHLPLVMAVQMVVLLLIQMFAETPYRQPQPLYAQDRPVNFGKPGSTLFVSNEFGKYIEEAGRRAKQAGFKENTPIIDMTGRSPGVLYALQAKSIGQAWNIGGYPGSLKLAIEALKRVPCRELATAWILAEPEGRRSIPNELLASVGADFEKDYEAVASWQTVQGVGGIQESAHQILLKPIRNIEVVVQACNEKR